MKIIATLIQNDCESSSSGAHNSKKVVYVPAQRMPEGQFLGTEALALGRRGVCEVTQFFGGSKTTVYNSINEIKSGYSPEPVRIRRRGGGWKRLLDSHPEWFEAFNLVIGPRIAGLPQDEGVIWVSMSAPEIVRQILEQLGFRRRSFTKDLPMKDVKDRDAQFLNIADIREKAVEINLPIISIDTKKKELVGNAVFKLGIGCCNLLKQGDLRLQFVLEDLSPFNGLLDVELVDDGILLTAGFLPKFGIVILMRLVPITYDAQIDISLVVINLVSGVEAAVLIFDSLF